MSYADMLKEKMQQKQGQRQQEDNNKERILVATKTTVEGAMHGWASNGLPLLDLGNGYGLNIVAHPPTKDGKKYRTVQLFQYAIDAKPKQQVWARTKTKTVTKEVQKKKEAPKKDIEFKDEVGQKDLFG